MWLRYEGAATEGVQVSAPDIRLGYVRVAGPENSLQWAVESAPESGRVGGLLLIASICEERSVLTYVSTLSWYCGWPACSITGELQPSKFCSFVDGAAGRVESIRRHHSRMVRIIKNSSGNMVR